MQRILSRLLAVETLIAGLFYVVAATLLLADVVSREVLNQSIWGAPRLAVLVSNASALIGISVAVSLNRHIRPPLLDWLFPDRFLPATQRFGFLISGLVMLVGCYFAILYVLANYRMGFTSAPLDLRVWIPQLALPYCMASAAFKYLSYAAAPDLAPG